MSTIQPTHAEPEPRQKQAACLECRKSKTKCIRGVGETICRKCDMAGSDCVVPEYHVGRYKGVKNKRSGLEKAISQVEQAIKRSRHSDAGLEASQAQALQQLLTDSSAQLTQIQTPSDSATTRPLEAESQPDPTEMVVTPLTTRRSISFVEHPGDAGDVTVNNADNPLQLLAIASAIPEQSPSITSPSIVNKTPTANGDVSDHLQNQTQVFFKPLQSKLDVSPSNDPIELGLITDEEADRLFDYFHQKLAHTRWGMDSSIHTASFVRSRSNFLFTTVLAASSLFLEDTAAQSKRLRNHVKELVKVVIAERFRSVEIVLAFMINVPWLIPGESWACDDETCYYISMALTIALDLMLNRMVIPSSITRSHGFLQSLSKTDSIDAAKALEVDGHQDVDPSSRVGRRLLRTRERTWLALLNLDRGVCLARGRPPTVPTSPLVQSCDTWHHCDVADRQDGALVSSTVLRRDFTGLVNNIRMTCDSHRLTVTQDPTTIKYMREQIEQFFEHWQNTWRFQLQQPDGRVPPYVEILASHTKLSAYCAVVNHPTVPPDVQQFFRAAGLNSALTVLKVAVQAESRLKSMPNNTVIMVSFAACFVLGLNSSKNSGSTLVAPNARALIEEVAEVLERIGANPAHRRGASALFGKHIKTILRQTIPRMLSPSFPQTLHSPNGASTDFMSPRPLPVLSHESTASLQFRTLPNHNVGPANYPIFDMSDDQIIAAITQQKDQIDALHADFHYDENHFMDWLEPWSGG